MMRKSRSEGICCSTYKQAMKNLPLNRRKTHVLGEHVGYEPGDGLALDLGLEVDTLDAEEDLAKRLGSHDVELPLGCQASTVGDDGRRDGCVGGEGGEEDDEGERIIQIAERVRECRVHVTIVSQLYVPRWHSLAGPPQARS